MIDKINQMNDLAYGLVFNRDPNEFALTWFGVALYGFIGWLWFEFLAQLFIQPYYESRYEYTFATTRLVRWLCYAAKEVLIYAQLIIAAPLFVIVAVMGGLCDRLRLKTKKREEQNG